jgi:hypothetical protein
MLARVTTWEGGSPEEIRAAAEDMRTRVASGPPEGMKTSGFTMLTDPDSGRVLMLGFFDSEDDLRASEAVLKEMNPPPGIGARTATDVYEVAAEARM